MHIQISPSGASLFSSSKRENLWCSACHLWRCLLNFLSTFRVPTIKERINLIKYEIAMKAYTRHREISRNYKSALQSGEMTEADAEKQQLPEKRRVQCFQLAEHLARHIKLWFESRAELKHKAKWINFALLWITFIKRWKVNSPLFMSYGHRMKVCGFGSSS